MVGSQGISSRSTVLFYLGIMKGTNHGLHLDTQLLLPLMNIHARELSMQT